MDDILRCEGRLSAPSVASRHAGRLCIPFQWCLLSVSGDVFWMETRCVLVYAIYAACDQEDKELGLSGAGIHRGCFNHPAAAIACVNASGFSACFEPYRTLFAPTGRQKAYEKRILGSWGPGREGFGLHC